MAHSHGQHLVLAGTWELTWACQLVSLHRASPCGLGISQHGKWVPGVGFLRSQFPEPQVEAVRLCMIWFQKSQNITATTLYGLSESPGPVQIQGEGHKSLGWQRPSAEEQVGWQIQLKPSLHNIMGHRFETMRHHETKAGGKGRQCWCVSHPANPRPRPFKCNMPQLALCPSMLGICSPPSCLLPETHSPPGT